MHIYVHVCANTSANKGNNFGVCYALVGFPITIANDRHRQEQEINVSGW